MLCVGCTDSSNQKADTQTSNTPSQEQASTPQPAPTPTPTPAASNYQDVEWLLTFTTDTTIVANDLKYISDAATNSDYTALSIYANSLFKDSQKAMDNSNLYKVSPDLQGTKNEYRLSMVDANWAAFYLSAGVEDRNKGDIQTASSDLNQATQLLESSEQHANNVTALLKVYNSNKK